MTGLPLRLAVLLLAVTLGAGCVDDYYRPAPERAEMPPNALRVGITPTYPPMIFKQGAQITGAEADLARLLGAKLGRPAYFVEVPWDQQIDALIAGKTDIIMSGMSVTEAREVRVAFAQPYLEGGLMAAVRVEDRSRYGSRDALLQSTATVGAIDVFVHDGPSIAWLVSANEADLAGIWQPLNRENLAWAMRRDDAQLLAQINDILGGWKRDGTLSGVLVRWLPYLKRQS